MKTEEVLRQMYSNSPVYDPYFPREVALAPSEPEEMAIFLVRIKDIRKPRYCQAYTQRVKAKNKKNALMVVSKYLANIHYLKLCTRMIQIER